MKKLRWPLALFTVVFIFSFFQKKNEVAPVLPQITQEPVAADVPPVIREPATLPAPKTNKIQPEHKTPSRVFASVPEELQLEKDPEINLGKNFALVNNLVALPIENWKEEMGAPQMRDSYFAFMSETPSGETAWPVAYDKVTNALYPVSHVLHLKKATEAVRQNLLKQGYKQYYFHARLKYLSLESTPKTVLDDYRKLKARGLDVRMEVLKDVVSSK